jgi:hypothetical protein
VSAYLPEGCTQTALDRYAGGYEPQEPEQQEEIAMLEEEYGYDDDTTKASCGHWDSESRLTYRADATSLCSFCALGATLELPHAEPPAIPIRRPQAVATGSGEDWMEMERRLRA